MISDSFVYSSLSQSVIRREYSVVMKTASGRFEGQKNHSITLLDLTSSKSKHSALKYLDVTFDDMVGL